MPAISQRVYSVALWDLAGRGKRRTIPLPDYVSEVAFLPGGNYLACSVRSRLSLINVLEDRVCATFTLPGRIWAMSPFQNESKLAVVTDKELLIVAIDLTALDKKNKR